MASAASDGPLAQSQNEHRDENSGSTTSAETGGGGGVKGAEVARLDALESLKDGATLAEDIELGAKTIENGKEKQDVVLPVPVAVEDADTDGTPRAWLVLFAAFSASVWAMAYPATWGIYVRTILLEGEFPGATSSTLQLAGTLAWGVMVVTTVFVGPISDKLPPQLLVTSGAIGMAAAAFCASYVNALWQFYPVAALYGIAGSFVYTPAPAMISIWFRKRRALAMGLFVSGSGVGSFINSAVAQACISAAGWRFGLKIMAAMIVGWMAPAGLLFKRKTKPKPRTGPLITLEYFKNSTFTLVFLSVLSIFFAFFMPQGFIPIMMVDGGYGNTAGAALVAAFSACLAVGRIIGGFFADRVGEVNMFVLSCAVPFIATTAIWIPAPTNIISTSIAAILWALFCGTPLVAMPILSLKEFGIERLGAVLGVLFVSFGPGELAGNVLLGVIVDKNTVYSAEGKRIGADYRPMLGFVSAVWFLGLVFIMWLRVKKVGWKVMVRI